MENPFQIQFVNVIGSGLLPYKTDLPCDSDGKVPCTPWDLILTVKAGTRLGQPYGICLLQTYPLLQEWSEGTWSQAHQQQCVQLFLDAVERSYPLLLVGLISMSSHSRDRRMRLWYRLSNHHERIRFLTGLAQSYPGYAHLFKPDSREPDLSVKGQPLSLVGAH